MPEPIQTGIEYPKITLGGVEYTVKFSRGALYRMHKAGVRLEEMGSKIRNWATEVGYSELVDLLHAALYPPFKGTPEDLAELIETPGDIAQAAAVVLASMGKMSPSSQKTNTDPAAPAVQ